MALAVAECNGKRRAAEADGRDETAVAMVMTPLTSSAAFSDPSFARLSSRQSS